MNEARNPYQALRIILCPGLTLKRKIIARIKNVHIELLKSINEYCYKG